MSPGIKLLVLDVLKPHQPNLPLLAEKLAEIDCISGVNISLIEIDKETESIKITIGGDDLDYEKIGDELARWNCSIHSVDKVIAGEQLIEEVPTHTD
ncbi:MAG: DUF211 domain-containing protein [Candidatus Helarchaeota archaeon]